MPTEYRIGQGIDVHRLVEGRPLILGGVKIPFKKGLLGYSDADVLIHALMDALLGAAGKDDIGKRFPSTDPRWKDADSLQLLADVWAELTAEGWQAGNIDCYLLAEAPKLSPHFAQMKINISRVLNCDEKRCSVRATTTEGLGYIGRGEGIYASAMVMLQRG